MTLSPKNKSLSFGIAVIAIAVFLSFMMTKTRDRPESEPPEPTPPAGVFIKEVFTSPYSPIVTTTARVAAKYDIDLVAQVSGVIESVQPDYARGTKIVSNQPLLKIDDISYLSALSQARSNVAQAEQTLASEKGLSRQAEREWRDLGSSEANQLFLRLPQIKSAEASLDAAKAGLLQAEQELERTELRAPFDGQLATIYANLGEFVTTGTPIVRLVSINHLEIAAPLTLDELSRLGFDSSNQEQPGLEREVEILVNTGFKDSGKQNITTTGTLLRIDNVIDEESQVAFAIVEVKDENTVLKPGQLVSINIQGNPKSNSVWLPEKALYERSRVLVVEENTLKSRTINVLDLRNEQLLVSGLENGVQVVTDRPLWSGIGSKVEIVREDENEPASSDTSNQTSVETVSNIEENKD